MITAKAVLLLTSVAAGVFVRFQPQSLLLALLGWVTCNLGYAVFRVFVYPFYFSPFRHLPEPSGGSFPWAHADLIRVSNNGEPYRQWINSTPNNGLIKFRVLMNQERLLLTSPEALREVLVTKAYQFVKPPEPAFLLQKLLGNGILVSEGEEHKRQRKHLMPAFSFRHIKDLYPIFWSKAKECVDAIAADQTYKNGPRGQQLAAQEAYDWAQRATLDIIGLAGMSHDFQAIADPNGVATSTYKEMLGEEGPLFFYTSLGVDLPVQWIVELPTRHFNKIRKAVNKIRKIASDLISEKHRRIADGKVRENDILSIAIESGGFSDEDLVNQMMTFLAAGHETTASALTWATYLLCQNPEIQTRLRNEIRSNIAPLSDPQSDDAIQQIDQLPLLNAVCNEVLRVMPSVPMTIRDAIEDTEILGTFVPKGTRIFVAAWAVNVSHELWGQDALTFNPDRWLGPGKANTGGAQSNFSNLTFIHGPRSCIGKDFAKAEFLHLLAAWVGRFNLRFEDKEISKSIIGWVTARPEHKLPIVFERIEGW
ncbi:hypothetical protein ANO11243_010270 [Dothideomycetidae sp. 11243]|nr:hypothetical protein ANO11243_010270 [fungal sp. No.11243]